MLATPGLNSFQNPRLELAEKAVRKWLNDLPILNPAVSVPALLERLREINHEPISFKVRFRLMELYREPVNRLFLAFDESGLHRLPVSREERARIKASVGELCGESCMGFKILLKQGLSDGMNPARDEDFRRSLLLTTEQLAHNLLHAYRSYGPLPAFALMELNQVYQLAEAAGVLDPVAGRLGKRAEPGIGHTYLNIILLAALDPFHMERCQCMQLYQAIGPIAPRARIYPWEPGHQLEDGEYLIDLNADIAPRTPRAGLNMDEDADARVLDTRALRVTSEELLEKEVSENTSIPRAQLRVLADALNAGRNRRSPRHASTEEVHLAASLPACMYFLRNQQRLRDKIVGGDLGIEVHSLSTQSEIPYGVERWRVENESIRGLLLARRRRDHEGLRVGDTVIVASVGSNRNRAPVMLGVIRWLRSDKGGDIQVGVETLPGLPRAVSWRTTADPSEQLGILLPPVVPLKLPYRLITAPDAVSSGQALEMVLGSETLTATGGEIDLHTGEFQQCSLASLKKA